MGISLTFLSCSHEWLTTVSQLLWSSFLDLIYLFTAMFYCVGCLPTKCEFYHWRCTPIMHGLREEDRKAWDGENSWKSMRGGVWRICSPTGHRVISRDAIMASLQQHRKHYETGLFTPTRACSIAESTLAPFSHPHILWTRALSAARLLCPHRRCHKTPSMPPISTQPRPLWS